MPVVKVFYFFIDVCWQLRSVSCCCLSCPSISYRLLALSSFHCAVLVFLLVIVVGFLNLSLLFAAILLESVSFYGFGAVLPLRDVAKFVGRKPSFSRCQVRSIV